jgi:peptidyl-prolyl cis-trans isomerase SurA
MQRKLKFLVVLSLFYYLPLFAHSSVYISVKVNQEIITNYDIKKEIKYLIIINPSLKEIKKEKVENIAKNSLINEKIKKNEIKKYFDLDKENPFVNEYFKNFYTELNFNNETEFKNSLTKEDFTINEIKEKLKIEIMWNELIYMKYNDQVQIDKENLLRKIDKLNLVRKKYLLSEIVFKISQKNDFIKIKDEINSSIQEIGFNNTANIYSISESSKIGGKLGWIYENSLSEKILEQIKDLKIGDLTNPIRVGNNFIILKIEEIGSDEIIVNKDVELEKMIKFETNKQLNQFSKVFFDKSKISYTIDEK